MDFRGFNSQDALMEIRCEGGILVLCPIGLGNFLMATPALRALSRGVGRERLSFLALKPSIAEMAGGSDLFNEVVCWDPDQIGRAHV